MKLLMRIWFFARNFYADAYVPDCDIQGFYRPTQCHSKIGICWCVDKHGVEFANTRKRGRPTCGKDTQFKLKMILTSAGQSKYFHSNESDV